MSAFHEKQIVGQKRMIFWNFGPVVLLAIAFAVSLGNVSADTIVYPDQTNPEFTIKAPDDWKLLPAKEDGGYMVLESESGATLWFRSIQIDTQNTGAEITAEEAAATLEKSFSEGNKWLEETYSNVTMEEPQTGEIDGMPAYQAKGTGVEKDGGSKAQFIAAWVRMDSDTFGEIWYVGLTDDAKSYDASFDIVKSFKIAK
jgi:hypothetical protein